MFPRRFRLLSAALLGVLTFPATAVAQQPGHGSPNLSYVQNIPYAQRFADQPANFGTDIEFATVRGARHAVAGSYYNGMHIVDIRRPDRPRLVGRYDCGILQGDVQVFRAADGTGRTLASYTSDAASRKTDTACFREAAALGFQPIAADGRGKQGTFIVDISNPAAPTTVSFIEVPQGSHNITVHPSGGWLYNSNSELMTSIQPAIEIIDIRDPDVPKHAGELSLSSRPGLGTESHDITFNAAGTRAYSAALSHGVVIDTTNPASPRVISEFDDETINVWHQSDPFTVRLPNGQQKSFLIVEDEFAGAAGGPVCPSGGVHVYDITGANEQSPQKVGYWNISDELGPTHDPEGTCTAHVFDVHESAQLMTIAFYNGGVRVVDLSGLATGGGLRAIASYKTDNANSWSFKAPSVTRTGVFHAFGNDIARGLDVYRFDGSKPPSSAPGVWIPGPAVGEPGGATGGSLPAGAPTAQSLDGYRMNCLIGSV